MPVTIDFVIGCEILTIRSARIIYPLVIGIPEAVRTGTRFRQCTVFHGDGFKIDNRAVVGEFYGPGVLLGVYAGFAAVFCKVDYRIRIRAAYRDIGILPEEPGGRTVCRRGNDLG